MFLYFRIRFWQRTKSWTSIVFLWEAGPLILVQIWHDMMSSKKQKWNKLLPFFMQDVFLQLVLYEQYFCQNYTGFISWFIFLYRYIKAEMWKIIKSEYVYLLQRVISWLNEFCNKMLKKLSKLHLFLTLSIYFRKKGVPIFFFSPGQGCSNSLRKPRVGEKFELR